MSSPLSLVTQAHVVSKEASAGEGVKDKVSAGSSFEQALKQALSDASPESPQQSTTTSQPSEKGNVKEKMKAKADELDIAHAETVASTQMPVWLSLQAGINATQATISSVSSAFQGKNIEDKTLSGSGMPSKKGGMAAFLPLSVAMEETPLSTGEISSLTSSESTSFGDVLSGSQIFKQNMIERDLPEASSKVTLSGEWTPSMISGLASGHDIEGTVGQAIKEVRSVLQEYWVPPVQVSTQSPTQAMVQLNLKNGEVMRLHIELGSAQTMNLRIEAPANVLADMQARLVPLQEALLQQGLSLSPIEWVAAKKSDTKSALGAVGAAKAGANGDRRGMNASDVWADDAVKAVASMEDVLE